MPPPAACRRIDAAERRARLAVRHHLAAPAPDVATAAADLVGLHSSDPVSVYLSAWSRVHGFQVAHLEEALYERRSLVRVLGMRRTMFVVPRDLAAVIDAACTRALAPAERRRLLKLIGDQGIAPHPDRWLSRVALRTLSALQRTGSGDRQGASGRRPRAHRKAQLRRGADVGRHRRSVHAAAVPAGDGGAHRPRTSPRYVDFQPVPVGRHQRVARRRPAGPGARGGTHGAGAALAGRVRPGHLAGPGVVDRVAAAPDPPGAGGGRRGRGRPRPPAPATCLEADLDPVPLRSPEWVALLPALDPTVMGWKERSWYLGDHQERLFDRNGNAGPTVWADGRVVGGWAQRPGRHDRRRTPGTGLMPSVEGNITAEPPSACRSGSPAR